MNARTFAATVLAFLGTFAFLQSANAASYKAFNPNNVIVQPNPNLQLAPLHVKCAAYSSPEFVHDATLLNDGGRPVPAGSKVHWVMGNRSGNYTFASMLPVHNSVSFDLHFSTSASHPCTATFVH